MSHDQMMYYQQKLNFETDSWDLYVALQNPDSAPVVIDGRSRDAYLDEHIPGAISLPHRTISPETTANLDTSRLYVAYCDGIGCNASTKTALKLLTLGFEVKELLGGLDWWRRDGYATDGRQARSGTSVDATCGCDGTDAG